MHKQVLSIGVLLIIAVSCKMPEKAYNANLSSVANDYVKLALSIGQYDEDFVDAYYGPNDWLPKKKAKESLPYEEFKWSTSNLLSKLAEIDDAEFGQMEMLRYAFLNNQIHAMQTKLAMMAGKTLPFDVESMALYDAVSPTYPISHYDSLLNRLEQYLPGEGTVADRYLSFSKQFIIPKEKLDTVFKTAIYEARKRVKAKMTLPDNENFVVEYVSDKPWSAYNWYKGNGLSLIQVNTDLPIYIERAIDLACHEGYPGHHVYNAMLEEHLVKQRKWNEFQIYPLFSPQSFIAEGTANYGVEMVFPIAERIAYEREVLFPLAGLNEELVDQYYQIQELRSQLSFAEIETARQYLNRAISWEEAATQLGEYLQFSPQRAQQRLNFYDKYRSYVINYSLGEEVVASYIEEAATNDEERWALFIDLLSTPRTASGL